MHIKDQDESQILKAGYPSVDAFIHEVTTGFNEARRGRGASLFLVKSDRPSKLAVVELRPSDEGDFYTVKTAHLADSRYVENKKLLWPGSERPAVPAPGAGSPLPLSPQGAGEAEGGAGTQSNKDIISEQAAPRKPSETLEQTKKGATQFLEDGKAILHLFETADVSTLVHELGHSAITAENNSRTQMDGQPDIHPAALPGLIFGSQRAKSIVRYGEN